MKGLILFDWDNTIVDKNYKINDVHLAEIIQVKIQEGWQIGLNSDTPFKRLYGWWKSLSMNGPIVAEKGAVIWQPNESPIILSSTADFFSSFQRKVIQKITTTEGYSLFYGDSTHFIGSVTQIVSNDSILVVLDAYRMCSLGIFVRRIVGGQLVCDISAVETIYDLLKSLQSSHSQVSELEINCSYCFLSVNALDVNKSTGVKALIEKWKTPNLVYMIGDSMADYLALPQVHQMAVGNAHPDYKELSSYVAQKNFAQGCIELITNL